MNYSQTPFWSIPSFELLEKLQTTPQSLMSDEALLKQVNEVDVFAEVEPNHKERIILVLKKAGNGRNV